MTTPSCLDTIRDKAYVVLFIACERCASPLEFPEAPADPVEDWAHRLAVYAEQAGWVCDNNGQIICPGCVS